eukprot:Hpha_TRINITY_DN23321_c0_g1::TRINITY_DN23321_c0_g1_i1::g.96823::m.96823
MAPPAAVPTPASQSHDHNYSYPSHLGPPDPEVWKRGFQRARGGQVALPVSSEAAEGDSVRWTAQGQGGAVLELQGGRLQWKIEPGDKGGPVGEVGVDSAGTWARVWSAEGGGCEDIRLPQRPSDRLKIVSRIKALCRAAGVKHTIPVSLPVAEGVDGWLDTYFSACCHKKREAGPGFQGRYQGCTGTQQAQGIETLFLKRARELVDEAAAKFLFGAEVAGGSALHQVNLENSGGAVSRSYVSPGDALFFYISQDGGLPERVAAQAAAVRALSGGLSGVTAPLAASFVARGIPVLVVALAPLAREKRWVVGSASKAYEHAAEQDLAQRLAAPIAPGGAMGCWGRDGCPYIVPCGGSGGLLRLDPGHSPPCELRWSGRRWEEGAEQKVVEALAERKGVSE